MAQFAQTNPDADTTEAEAALKRSRQLTWNYETFTDAANRRPNLPDAPAIM